MWIKASGTWLANAADTELFVPVELDPLRKALEAGDSRAEKSLDFVRESLNPNKLRPSIETTVHAALPQAVVVHVHCVDTIALAVQSNGEQQLSNLLSEFNWLWVPYCRPGLPLSRTISARYQSGTDVIVLGNHGLVVAAESVDAAATLLKRVRLALRRPVRGTAIANPKELQKLAQKTDYVASNVQETHAVAMDESALQFAAGGSLYPDHVIFLGAGTVLVRSSDELAKTLSRYESPPVTIAVEGLGVLMHKKANASQHAMARCLSDVCLRVPPQANLHYLNEQEEYQLLNWEAETYRQSIAT